MPAPKPPPPSAKKRAGRPRNAVPPPPVTGFRVPLELLERLDVVVERRAAELERLGGSTSRNALVVAAIREFCEREEAAARASAPPPSSSSPSSGS